jgi:hypothetical protein
VTRVERFLIAMERVMPWDQMEDLKWTEVSDRGTERASGPMRIWAGAQPTPPGDQ